MMPMRRKVGGLVVLAMVLTGATLQAQDVPTTVDETIETRLLTQQEKDQWSAEKAQLVQRFRAAQANVTWLENRRGDELARVEALEGRVAEFQRRLGEADRLEGSMQDSLEVVLDRLADSIDRGLPFLPTERAARLEQVRAELAKPDVSSAEKLRRLLEALQIEASYAASVEVYQDRIQVDAQDVHADILRLGRLSLFWRTPDGARVGVYDPAAGVWTELSGAHKRRITRAMEMATRMRPVEIIDLPLGRITP